jgi:hypothetical protein
MTIGFLQEFTQPIECIAELPCDLRELHTAQVHPVVKGPGAPAVAPSQADDASLAVGPEPNHHA